LTRDQVDAVKRIYAGPKTSNGEPITGGTIPGSELGWPFNFDSAHWQKFAVLQALEYTLYGAEPPVISIDFDRDYRRVGLGALLRLPYANPDLRQFKQAGGKLIAIQGGNDSVLTARDFIDYYETAERTMGGRAVTQDFFRLFVVPGLNHCSGGNGAVEFDRLGYLEAWVEQGRAPDVIVGARVKDSYIAGTRPPEMPYGPFVRDIPLDLTPERRRSVFDWYANFPLGASVPVEFTRPFYPYPAYPRYKGRGDSHDAANFYAATP
jgi:feruloyl esterase